MNIREYKCNQNMYDENKLTKVLIMKCRNISQKTGQTKQTLILLIF